MSNAHPVPSDLEQTLQTLKRHALRPCWLTLDGFHFTADYQKAIRENGHKLLVIDDMAHLEYYHADILLNQNIFASSLHYFCDQDTVKLLGCEYVLLRREFLRYKNWKREIPKRARKILVTMGGSDPDNVTLKVVRLLNSLNDPDLEVKVIAGPANQNVNSLEKELQLSSSTFHLLRGVSDMPELMAWADAAISAAGTTCWELAFMGLPSLVIALADNQRSVAKNLEAEGAAGNLGWHEDLAGDKVCQTLSALLRDPIKREDMARVASKLVDGRGVDRVTRELQKKEIRLRSVQEDDCRLLWDWANDPDVRTGSFSSEPISWEQHLKWFKSKMADKDCLIFLAADSEGSPIGQARFERKKDNARISVSVRKGFRDSGYGSRIIELASKKVFEVFDIQKIDSYIKIENKPSKSAFTNAGYKEIGLKTIKGHRALHLRLTK
jgi:UDP-2,4-diacetamido-2,4,6-trideoxy-beta-L-altropyranose hydrolase